MPFTRRKFLGGLTALIGGLALEEAIPFNRVWSFPSKIVVPNLAPLMTIYYDPVALETLKRNLVFSPGRMWPDVYSPQYLVEVSRSHHNVAGCRTGFRPRSHKTS